MNTLVYKGYSARIEYDAEDELFFGKIAGIRDGITFHANNVADLKSAFYEAVDDYITTCAQIGKSPQKPYSGNVMLRINPAVHSRISLAAELAGKSLNQWSEEVLSHAAEK
jgi:predicted HicB family RNase H-like nuclease